MSKKNSHHGEDVDSTIITNESLPNDVAPPGYEERVSNNNKNKDNNSNSSNNNKQSRRTSSTSLPQSNRPRLKPRKVIGNYSLVTTLGSGSMGKVKLAMHNITHDKVSSNISSIENRKTRTLKKLWSF